ncbi:MAG: phenylacetate-CoA ligase [Cellvibrionaceae bacterium]|jgi:phenylacetate-CoA ligase
METNKIMIWNEPIETMSRSEIEALQSERLAKLAAYVYERVPFYKDAFDQAGVSPADIKDIRDVTKLPFTYKKQLRENYPFKLFAVPMNEVIRTHASSGTTGKPTVVGYTRNDIAVWSELVARCFGLSGAKPGDVFQNAYGYGLFTGGLGMHYGSELMGLNTIPVSGGNTTRQILLLQDFQTDIMACTPSYALTLADALNDAGIDPADLPVRTFILGAEPWTDEMRHEIEERLHADAVNIYGLSEIMGPGVSNECVEAKDGMHLMDDHFFCEIIDPKTGEQLAEGEVGELVITTLTKEAIPMIRYRTGDLCSITTKACICGRTHSRMSRILGRADDMLIIRGVNVFPSQIEATMIVLDELSPHYNLIVTREDRLDRIEIQPEVTEEFFRLVDGTDGIHNDPRAKALAENLAKMMRESLLIGAKITLIAPGTAPRSEGGKIKRVQDNR